MRILDILLHELIHARLPDGAGHNKDFRTWMKKLGLKGKPTATIAEKGSPLYDKLKEIVEKLGPLPPYIFH